MQFGLVLPTERGASHDASAAWETIERQAELADTGGLDSLWVGEHHFVDNLYFDNFQTLSFLASITERVTLGTSVCLAPLYNPVRLAERVANLDVQSDGRTILGLGLGYRKQEFDVLGVDRSRRVPRLLETLDLLEQCWSEDDSAYDGEEFSFESVTVNPKPLQDGGPPIWLGGKSRASLKRAAQLGDAWLPAPSYTVDDLEQCYAVYEEAFDDEPSTRPLWREVFIDRDHERAVERARESLVGKYDSYSSWHQESGQHDDNSVEERFEAYHEGRFLVGTPDEVIADLETYRERFGTDHLLVRTQWPGLADDAAETSLELFLDEVVSEFA
ncbi:LLM class flavin-dependent oxidoreductase [Haloarchaeobius salinus]|uniref:LLM class flavin-dependent oxidoreductase n=1 Tax=Haloarchaeobius salinus TaxID=1198298 RepID=UPI00210F0757|nr:LLM class flavin-dependent oxidoreductase [Haloarchaeobius salinus]